jgi:hypothetical protein
LLSRRTRGQYRINARLYAIVRRIVWSQSEKRDQSGRHRRRGAGHNSAVVLIQLGEGHPRRTVPTHPCRRRQPSEGRCLIRVLLFIGLSYKGTTFVAYSVRAAFSIMPPKQICCASRCRLAVSDRTTHAEAPLSHPQANIVGAVNPVCPRRY